MKNVRAHRIRYPLDQMFRKREGQGEWFYVALTPCKILVFEVDTRMTMIHPSAFSLRKSAHLIG